MVQPRPFLSASQGRSLAAAVVFLIFLSAAAYASRPSVNEGNDHLVRQLKDLTLPVVSLDPETEAGDLEALRSVIGDAAIVLLGESRHRLREQYRLKHRIVKYLVEEMAFTHILIEDSYCGALAIDDYIKGANTLPEKALGKTGGWYLWDTEEMLALVRWLRTHNDGRPEENKVSYVGLDIQDPWPGIEVLLRYFGKVDRTFAGYLESRREVFDVFHKPIWIAINNSYPKLSADQKTAIEQVLLEVEERLDNHREEYLAQSGEKLFRDINLVVGHLIKSHRFFLDLETAEPGEVGIREKTMFANVVRIKESGGEKTRIIVWAHNAHAAKSPVRFLNTGIPESAPLELMGTMLKKKYGNLVRSIGMASLGASRENPDFEARPGILDHVLAGTGLELGFLDFQRLSERQDIRNRLNAPWKLTADMGGLLALVPAEAYDGLFFIKYATAARPSPESARRFKMLF